MWRELANLFSGVELLDNKKVGERMGYNAVIVALRTKAAPVVGRLSKATRPSQCSPGAIRRAMRRAIGRAIRKQGMMEAGSGDSISNRRWADLMQGHVGTVHFECLGVLVARKWFVAVVVVIAAAAVGLLEYAPFRRSYMAKHWLRVRCISTRCEPSASGPSAFSGGVRWT